MNLQALIDDPVQFLKVPMFLALFLLVRGAPALLLYRKVLDARERAALALFSATELPLVVAITTIAVEEGHMRSSTAASLILAAICSTAIYPILGLRAASRRREAIFGVVRIEGSCLGAAVPYSGRVPTATR